MDSLSVPVARPAGTPDASRLGALAGEFYQHERLEFGPAVTEALALLLADSSHGRVWIFEAQDGDAGYMVLAWGFSLEFGGRIGIVDELYVRAEYRGAGLGGRALEAAAAACRAEGVRALRLEVDHANPNAARLYERVGFSGHARRIMTRPVHG